MSTINCNTLQRELNSLCNFLDEVYEINYGGCCFLASEISKHLDILGLSYDLVIYNSEERDQLSIEQEIKNCRSNKSREQSITGRNSCNHYCLQLQGSRLINSADYEVEYEDGDSYKYVISKISHKNINWIYKRGGWNDDYNVSHNKTIKNIVKEFFKEYEEEFLKEKAVHLS